MTLIHVLKIHKHKVTFIQTFVVEHDYHFDEKLKEAQNLCCMILMQMSGNSDVNFNLEFVQHDDNYNAICDYIDHTIQLICEDVY